MNEKTITKRQPIPKDNGETIKAVNFYTKIKSLDNEEVLIYANGDDGKPQLANSTVLNDELDDQSIHVLKVATNGSQKLFYFEAEDSGWIDALWLDNTTRWFDVPLISQLPELPTGCEITAVTMMLQHVVGKRVNKMKLAREMPRNQNPDKGFVGSPYSDKGWYIYPKGLISLVNYYTHNRALDMTGCSVDAIKHQIDKNKPVVIWMADIDGFPNHALTVYGYDQEHLFMNDPWINKRIKKSLSYLTEHRGKDAMRTLSYY